MGVGYGIVEAALVTVDVDEVAVAFCPDDFVEIVVRVGIKIKTGEAERVVVGTGLAVNDGGAEGAQGDGSFVVTAAADRLVSEMSGVGTDGDPTDACRAALAGWDGEDGFIVADFDEVLALAGHVGEMLGLPRENDGAEDFIESGARIGAMKTATSALSRRAA